jgi:putative hydrolase of the HAD superfamily
MAIRAALFDFGGVIVDSPMDVFAAYEREHGLPAGVLNRVVVEAGDAGPWPRLECGELDLDAFVEAFQADLARHGFDVDVAALMEAIGRLRPRPPMLDAVRRTRERVPVALGTNNWKHPGMTSKLDAVRDEFDVIVESCELGIRKPDLRFYAAVCDRLGVPPQAVVFLDDLGRNLKPARAMGMTTIKVADVDSAIAELDAVLDGAVTT